MTPGVSQEELLSSSNLGIPTKQKEDFGNKVELVLGLLSTGR